VINKKRVSIGASLFAAIFALAVSTSSAAAASCPNEVSRIGLSTGLPDCRAYELVSPSESNGRMLEAISLFTLGRPHDLFPTELASPVKDSFVYETYAGALEFPDGGSGAFDVYRAERQAAGWNTVDHLSRSPTSLVWPLPGGISRDHAYSFQDEGNSASYLRNSQGSYELTGIGSLDSEPAAQGRYISEGGRHVIFTTGDEVGQSDWCSGCPVLQLEPDAPPTGTGAVYDRAAAGSTYVVSLLPGNDTPAANEEAFYRGVSTDGTAVAFMVEGVLYVRLNREKTLEVASGHPDFAGFSGDGRLLFYVAGGTIHRLDTQEADDSIVNPSGEAEVVNISADGSHVYFISKQQLDGSEGTVGEPNLYVWTKGELQYVATVAYSDLVRTSGNLAATPALTNWTDWVFESPSGTEAGPGAESSRATPDGSVLVFESRAALTGYDNANPAACPSWVTSGPDGIQGTPDDEVLNPEGRCTEIYRYNAEIPSLQCVSCNPTNSNPAGDSHLQDLERVGPPFVLNNVSSDGSRVFFESPGGLVPGDSNDANDIYEWEQDGSPLPLHLITSGKAPEYSLPEGWPSPFTPKANVLLSITPSGNDVFFSAREALVAGAGENGTQAIYDARVGGGFPNAPTLQNCQEEGCRKTEKAMARALLPPLSETISGAGNFKPRKHNCKREKNGARRRKHRRCHKKRHISARASAVGSSASQPRAVSEATPSSGSVADLQADPEEPAAVNRSTASAVSEAAEFGIERFEVRLSASGAGVHPDLASIFTFNHTEVEGDADSKASAEEISIDLPPGFLGNPAATPTCSMGDFVSFGNCSPATQVGAARLKVGNPLHTKAAESIYNLAPPHPSREVARLGIIAWLYPVFIDIKVRTASDYGVTAIIHGAPGVGALVESKATLWGSPSSSLHDKERLSPFEVACSGKPECTPPPEGHPSGIPAEQRKAFMTNPSACQEGQANLAVTAYQLPGQTFTASAPLAPITDCTGLPFGPSFEADPTSHEAGAPTGLKTKLILPQHLGPDERATSAMREARVTLPEGMQVAAGAANWIDTCSDSQVGYHEEVDTACPGNSKLGTATIISPALSVPIEGTIYQRSPQPGHQLGLWLTADALGLHIKLPGSLEPDKQTGRLTAVFADLPQVPVSEIDLNVWGGPRAPLQNPDHCGTFATDFTFSPHSDDPTAIGQSTMQITEGCNQPFEPTLHAGVTDPVAGKYSPFVFDLSRPDGQQALRGFSLHLPDGELAKLKGVPLCSDADAGAGTCPPGSRIGSLQATTGPGPEPFTIPEPGKPQPQIYLSGPYQDAPFSILSEVPAQAGPFDLGTLAVRSGLDVEPETGRAVVKADPLPQFFEGVGIAYRNLHAVVDRPGFNLNPTDCREMAVVADATSTQGTVAHPAARFQVDGCKRLKFKPKLSLALRGGTKRADYPALTAVLKARKGDANIAATSVALPHSEFLAQEHIGTICTRKQFAADKCPKGSVYGKAKALTPLLDKPLAGPVYLRSSNHPLPDLVAKLGGQLEIDLVGRIDSVHGGIRTTFESVPDAPVRKFVLQMRGGKKGLLTNSTDICRGSHRATVAMKAQNGRAAQLRPVLVAGGCAKTKPHKHKKHHR